MKPEKKVVPFPAAPKPRDREELAFLPAALEIVETPPSPAGGAISATLIVLFVLGLAWASLRQVDIVGTATGKIIPTGYSKVIQPFETGVVRAIRVANGQNGNAGDALIELDPTINEGEINPLKGAFQSAQLDISRLRAALGTPLHRRSSGGILSSGGSQSGPDRHATPVAADADHGAQGENRRPGR